MTNKLKIETSEDDPYTLKLHGQITPVKCVRVRKYGQGTLTDEQWEEFKQILHEVVEEIKAKEYEELGYPD